MDSDIEPIRKMIGRHLMSTVSDTARKSNGGEKRWAKEGQKQLDDMLITLHQTGFITLLMEDGSEWVAVTEPQV